MIHRSLQICDYLKVHVTPVDEPESHWHVLALQSLIVSLIEIGKRLSNMKDMQKESIVVVVETDSDSTRVQGD